MKEVSASLATESDKYRSSELHPQTPINQFFPPAYLSENGGQVDQLLGSLNGFLAPFHGRPVTIAVFHGRYWERRRYVYARQPLVAECSGMSVVYVP